MANSDALWLPVLPELSGFSGALTKGVAGKAAAGGKLAGVGFGKAFGVAAASIAGVAAAGTALFNVGKTFQDMTNTIRVGTGAAGADLDGMVDIAKRVGTQVPHEFDAVGNAVADLNTMMGLSGDDLETVSAQVLEVGRMFDEDIDISSLGQAMNAFGIESEDVSGQLDLLMNVSQSTGIGINELMEKTRQAAPSADALGLSFEEVALMTGQLDKAGLDSGKMMQRMSRDLGKLAKDGEEPRDTFNRVIGEIDGFIESGDRVKAQDLAKEAFGSRNAEQFVKAIDDGTLSLESFGDVSQLSGDTIMGLSDETMTFGEHWQEFKNKILVALEPIADRVFGGMSDLMDGLSEALTDRIIPAFEGFVDWLGRAKIWLIPLVAVVAGFAGAVIAVNAAVGAWTAITKAWTTVTTIATAIQKGFNAAMKANPIGLVITAITLLVGALVWFFTKTEVGQQLWETFTNALGTAWDWVTEKIGGAASWLWEEVLSPFFTWIGDTWDTVWGWLSEVWETKGQPIWDALHTAAMWVWGEVLEPFFGWLSDAWGNLMGWLGEAWTTWGAVVWSAIETAALWLWEKVLEPVFSFIGRHWDKVLTAMKWAWDHILRPAWDVLVIVATWLWEKVLKKIFTWIGDHWEEILFAMKYIWEKYLKPAWERMKSVATWLWEKLSDIFTWISDKWSWMKDKIVGVYNKHIKPVFDKFGDIVTDLKDKFKTGVDNIKKQWDKLKSIAAKPVKFVIEDIFNDGLINTLNKIPGVNISDIPMPKWAKEYADGGWTGPGSRLTPAGLVHADEYVVRKASRGRFESENPGMLDHINRHGTMAGYAKGGLVRPVSGPLTSRFGAGRGRYPHAGVDWAVPVGTPVKAALAGTALGRQPAGRTGRHVFLSHPGGRNTYYGHLSRPMVSAGDSVAKGQTIGLSGNTGRSTGPHLHFETWTGGKPVNPLQYMGGLPESSGGGDDGGGWFDILAPFRAIGDKIKSSITDKFPGSGFMVDAAGGIAKQGFDNLLNWAKSKIPGLGDPDDGAGGGGAGMGAGSQLVRGQVQGVAEGFGWGSGAEWNALSQIIQRESSWNLNAANPSSSARGLFQKMTSIHGPVADTAAGQAEWGLPYIKRTYGTPSRALAFHDRNNWYDQGGRVNSLYRDKGGNLPPGLSMVLNKTGRDEAILNSRQWADIHSLAQRGSGGSGVHIENAYALSHKELARDITTQQRRSKALQLI